MCVFVPTRHPFMFQRPVDLQGMWIGPMMTIQHFWLVWGQALDTLLLFNTCNNARVHIWALQLCCGICQSFISSTYDFLIRHFILFHGDDRLLLHSRCIETGTTTSPVGRYLWWRGIPALMLQIIKSYFNMPILMKAKYLSLDRKGPSKLHGLSNTGRCCKLPRNVTTTTNM